MSSTQGEQLYRVGLAIDDTDRRYQATHRLILARHPSESVGRLMVRVLAFAHNAEAGLRFTKGLCVAEQPDLWSLDPQGGIRHWIGVGEPDVRRVIRACRRSLRVTQYAYHERSVASWYRSILPKIETYPNLVVFSIGQRELQALAELASLRLQLHCRITDGTLHFCANSQEVVVAPRLLHGSD